MKLRSVVAHAAQFVGGCVALFGVFLLAGLAWTIVVGGLATVGLGVLIESGRI